MEGVYTSEINLNSEKRAVQTSYKVSELRSIISYYIEFENSKIEVTVSLDKGDSALKYDVTANWFEINRKNGSPKLIFKVPFAFETEKYTYDIQLGTFEREETSLHDWYGRDFIYAADKKGKGIALFTDTKYGYRGADNTLQVSLLRATSNPDPYPEYGVRRVRMAVGIAENDYDSLHRYATAFENDMPFISNTSHKGALPLKSQILSCEGACTAAVKCSDDGKAITVRLYNPRSFASNAVLSFCKDIRSAKITDSAEYGDEKASFAKNRIEIKIGPKELKTVIAEF